MPNNIRNIKSFKLFDTKWSVEHCDTIEDGDNWSWGREDNGAKLIKIGKKDPSGNEFKDDIVKITYYHELIHAILDEGSYFNESENEPMVEWIAKCLASLSTQNKLV